MRPGSPPSSAPRAPTEAEAGTPPADAGEPWRPEELAAASGLAQMVRRIPLSQDGSPDTESELGRTAMGCLLRSLDVVSHKLGVELAARDYWAALEERHQQRWTDPECLYSMQMLAKCFLCPGSDESHNEVVVNGQAFQMSRHATRLSGRLRRKWSEVFWMLKELRKRPTEVWGAAQRASLRGALGALDHGWAAFEERFFAELRFYEMQAEVSASRGADLVRVFRGAVAAAAGGGGGPEGTAAAAGGGAQAEAASGYALDAGRQLVDYISQLNLTVNPGCTGRSFGAEVMMVAEKVISQAQGSHQHGAILDPACLIAGSAIDAFHRLCDCIVQSGDNWNSDQQLCAGLIKLLVAWESSWELAATYVVDESRRHALRALVDCLRKAQAVSHDLATICDGRDPELFLVLPRIAWLCFLERQPEVAPLLTPLLPHRVGKDLQALQREFWRARAALAGEDAHAPTAQAAGQDHALVHAAVVGAGGDFTDLGLPEHTEEVLRSFMRTVEGWSLELQRHRAGGWNHLCAVILWCLDAPWSDEPEQGGQ